MSWYYKPRLTADQRRASGLKEIERLKKSGITLVPLPGLTHRIKIATSFWGRAWCEHLEGLGDYENRLPRGRTYLRSGSVLHLSIEPGRITALVQGSLLYEQTILIDPLSAAKWKQLKNRCQGGFGSLLELLQGQLSDEVMAVVTDPSGGLFPKSREIKASCSCPDWAGLCKHLAAILYGVGAKLDQEPELLFRLRGVDHRELIDEGHLATAITAVSASDGRRTLDPGSIEEVFGIELDAGPVTLASDPTVVSREPEAKRGTALEGSETASAVPTPKNGRKRSPDETPPFSVRIPFVATGSEVRRLRKVLQLSRAEFAEWVGVSTASVHNWEKRTGPLNLREASLTNLRALHDGLTRER